MSTHDHRYQNHEVRVQRLRELPADLKHCEAPQAVYDYWMSNIVSASWYNPEVEALCVIHLNTRLRATGFHLVSMGTQDQVLVHAREVFRGAIVAAASKIVIAHNHPSGDPSPSEADIRVTRDLMRGGQLLKIEVMDHVVIGQTSPERAVPYCSLRELGYFYS